MNALTAPSGNPECSGSVSEEEAIPVQEFDERGRGYWKCPGMDTEYTKGADPKNAEDRHPCTKAEANLVSSLTRYGTHRPVLDLDLSHKYVPSTTPGHGHLYLDVAMPWPTYEKLLLALKEAGVLERGYVDAAIQRGASFVRPEGVKKPEKA